MAQLARGDGSDVSKKDSSAHRGIDSSVLEIESLRISFPSPAGPITPVRGVSLSIPSGARVAIVGESGSGKSLTARAAMGLIRPPAQIEGRVAVNGQDVLSLSPKAAASMRGREIAMVFQDPLSSLNPIMRVGKQLSEALRVHSSMNKREARQRSIELLDEVGIQDPARRVDAYPHELSGGMRQRVMIAMAISGDPELLIADEATSALDVTTQAKVLDLMAEMADQRRMAVVLITHDLAVAAGFADVILTMYAGRVVESARVGDFTAHPIHPYSEALLAALLRLDVDVSQRLVAIPGQPPLAEHFPSGCAFHPRCKYATEVCRTTFPKPTLVNPVLGEESAHFAECHYAVERSTATSEASES